MISDPPGATIYRNGQSTGLRTPEDLLQPGGTTAQYSVVLDPYVYNPASITVSNIDSEQTLRFQTGTGSSGEVIIYQLGLNLVVQWPQIRDAISYNVYHSSDPYGGFDPTPIIVMDPNPDDGIVWWEFPPVDDFKFFKVTGNID